MRKQQQQRQKQDELYKSLKLASQCSLDWGDERLPEDDRFHFTDSPPPRPEPFHTQLKTYSSNKMAYRKDKPSKPVSNCIREPKMKNSTLASPKSSPHSPVAKKPKIRTAVFDLVNGCDVKPVALHANAFARSVSSLQSFQPFPLNVFFLHFQPFLIFVFQNVDDGKTIIFQFSLFRLSLSAALSMCVRVIYAII